MTHTVFLDTVNELARAAATGSALPNVSLKLRSDQTIALAFMAGGIVASPSGWSSGKIVVKERPTTAVLLLDTTLTSTTVTYSVIVASSSTSSHTVTLAATAPATMVLGATFLGSTITAISGTTITLAANASAALTSASADYTVPFYNAAWTPETLDGPTDGALLKYLGDTTLPKEAWCEVQWIDAAGQHSIAFPITLTPSFSSPEDEAPDPAASASWEWIKARLAAGSNITLTPNDTTKVLTIAASGGGGGGTWGSITGTLASQSDLATALGLKAPLANPALTGTPTAPTASGGTNTTQVATTAFVHGATSSLAPLASPALTGTPVAPTPAASDNSTNIATTAFVQTLVAGLGCPSIAFVNSIGDDSTAAIGDPWKPYATWQAAYDAGAIIFNFGYGAYGNLTGLNRDIMLIGCGVNQCAVGNINGTSGSVYGNGQENISVGSIYIGTPNGADGPDQATDTGHAGTNGTTAASAPTVNISGITGRSDVVVFAGNGGKGGKGATMTESWGKNGGIGGDGGAGGTLNVSLCTIGGYAVSFGGNSGDGGNGGDSSMGFASGGDGGNSGNAGYPGTVNIVRSRVSFLVAGAASVGTAGTGGGGITSGSDGTAGAAGSVGTLNVYEFAKIDNAPTSGETLNVHQSVVQGTWIP